MLEGEGKDALSECCALALSVTWTCCSDSWSVPCVDALLVRAVPRALGLMAFVDVKPWAGYVCFAPLRAASTCVGVGVIGVRDEGESLA